MALHAGYDSQAQRENCYSDSRSEPALILRRNEKVCEPDPPTLVDKSQFIENIYEMVFGGRFAKRSQQLFYYQYVLNSEARTTVI